MRNKQWLLALSFAAILFTSFGCDDDGPEIVDEPEIITNLTFTFTPVSGGPAVTLDFEDLDGDGGMAPTQTVSGNLTANTVYNGSMTLFNRAVNPAEDIGEEIAEEDDEHQFFFATSNGLDLSFAYTDMDDDGNPIGLTTEFNAGAASSGGFQIILLHEPVKDAPGVAQGDITNADGETDIEVVFDLEIQ